MTDDTTSSSGSKRAALRTSIMALGMLPVLILLAIGLDRKSVV